MEHTTCPSPPRRRLSVVSSLWCSGEQGQASQGTGRSCTSSPAPSCPSESSNLRIPCYSATVIPASAQACGAPTIPALGSVGSSAPPPHAFGTAPFPSIPLSWPVASPLLFQPQTCPAHSSARTCPESYATASPCLFSPGLSVLLTALPTHGFLPQ